MHFVECRTRNAKHMKIKKSKASVLVASLIIMGIVLIASLSIAFVAVKERRASIEESKTTVVFQSADQAVEAMMAKIYRGGFLYANQLGVGYSCDASGILIDSTHGYTIEFLDNNSNRIFCNTSVSIGDIARIKVTSTTSQVGRAIEAKIGCDITTCQQLNSHLTAGGYHCLANDIPCAGVYWNPVWFSHGVLDGKGFVVKNLTVSAFNSYAGLFSTLSNATVKNLGIVNANVQYDPSGTGYGNWGTGILAGVMTSYSLVSNCYTSGDIGGDGYEGGIIGQMYEGTRLDQSYSTAKVHVNYANKERFFGGLVGYNQGNITNSYSTGNVSGNYFASDPTYNTTQFTGGIVGYNGIPGTISNVYFGGTVRDSLQLGTIAGANMSNLFNYFYNVDKNPCTAAYDYSNHSLPITSCPSLTNGKTTSEMEDNSTYSDPSWNFDTIWLMAKPNIYPFISSSHYPCLKWQGSVDYCPPY